MGWTLYEMAGEVMMRNEIVMILAWASYDKE
jgi:hypothetical protein